MTIEGYLEEFLAEGDDEVDFFGEGKDGTSLCMGRECGDGCLLNTAVVKVSAGAIEGEGVASMAFAVPVKKVRGIHLAV